MLICKNKKCLSPVPETEDRCPVCGTDIGFPNVRAAAAESSDLNARYAQAAEDAYRDGRHDSLVHFTESMARTHAVINVDLRFLHQLLSDPKEQFSTYQLRVRAQARKAAAAENDKHRIAIDAMFFGSYGDRIRYAALSADGKGLKSYGDYSVRLREVSVADRASLLEENTYKFVERHDVRPGRPMPSGYRSTWLERDKLAAAKLASLVLNGVAERDYSALVLRNGDTRDADQFIEVHIYGPLDSDAIESVQGKSTVKKQPERGLASQVKAFLKKAGKSCVEE